MPRIEKLDQLDQKSLGDLKLSKEEKTYLSDKTELMYNDIKEKLFLDIRAANFKLLEGKTGASLDEFISSPEKIQPYLKKEEGLKLYTNALNAMKDIAQKRAIVLNFLLSSFTKDFQNNYNLTSGFNFDTIKLMFHFQKEHSMTSDCVFGGSSIAELLKTVKGQGFERKTSSKNLHILTTKDNKSINTTETTSFTECAEYVIDALMDSFDRPEKSVFTTLTGIVGNAWTMYDNIKSKLGKSVYNAFADKKLPADILTENSVEKVKKYVEESCAESSSKLDVKKCKKGDVVGLYYPKSSNHLKAAQGSEAGTCNTHVGYIRDVMEDGTPIISHNVHGTVYNQPANELLTTKNPSTCMITWVARPNLNRI